jgi:hypothetical protein
MYNSWFVPFRPFDSCAIELEPVHWLNPAMRARVEDPITPSQSGQIYFKGSYWSAELVESPRMAVLPTGSTVFVLGRRSLTLLVVPIG